MEKLEGMDKVRRVLELQDQGKTQEEIAIALGHEGKSPARALRNFMRSWGYRSEGTLFPKEPNGEIISKSKKGTSKKGSITKSTSNSNTFEHNINTLSTQDEYKVCQNEGVEQNCVESVGMINTQCRHTLSNTLSDEQYKKLLKMLDNYDNIMSITSSSTTNNTSSNTNIEITPATYPIGVTIKVDGETWKRFKKYCKASEEKQQDLITTALNMLMKSGV